MRMLSPTTVMQPRSITGNGKPVYDETSQATLEPTLILTLISYIPRLDRNKLPFTIIVMLPPTTMRRNRSQEPRTVIPRTPCMVRSLAMRRLQTIRSARLGNL